jgi:sulfoxide reductase heme-binding subunit YedZ
VATWIRDNWRWAVLNVVALAIMIYLLRMAAQDRPDDTNFGPLVESGKWAVRFLLLSLAMTPLNTLLGWRGVIPLRKPAGLWAFGFGGLHFLVYIRDSWPDWLDYPVPDYLAGLGLVGLLILTALAATSTRWAMRRLGKNWKRLHRLVYAAGIVLLLHGLLEARSSKRVNVYDPQTSDEVMIYVALLVVLLVARIPVVRSGIASLRHRQGFRGKKDSS